MTTKMQPTIADLREDLESSDGKSSGIQLKLGEEVRPILFKFRRRRQSDNRLEPLADVATRLILTLNNTFEDEQDEGLGTKLAS